MAVLAALHGENAARPTIEGGKPSGFFRNLGSRAASRPLFRCIRVVAEAARRSQATGNGANHYEVLGVAYNASKDDIKAAFRQLAHKYHPDVNKGADAQDMFKSVLAAYEVLSDQKARRTYDSELYNYRDSLNMKYGHRPRAGYHPSEMESFAYAAEAYDDGTLYQLNGFERAYGRRRRKFEPTWVRQARAVPRSRPRYESKLDDREKSYSPARDLIAELEDAQGFLVGTTWVLACIWQVFGTQYVLATLLLAAVPLKNLSLQYKLALLGTCWIGGAKGLLTAFCVIFMRWIHGAACDAATLSLVLGLYLHSITGSSVYFPPVLIPLTVHKLMNQCEKV